MGYRVFKMKSDNRGFTLVELLVAVALVAVVGTAVFGFMTVGSKTFASTSSEVNLQSESQLAFNQMQDLIIDTVVGIDYGYLPAGSSLDVWDYNSYTGNWVNIIPAGTACEAKKLVMYNLDKVYEITWTADDNKLYYTEYNTDPSHTDVVTRQGAAVVPHALMAEYVKDFNVDLSLMQAKRVVRLDTTYEKNGKEYTSSHNVTLRNKPLSGNSIPAYVAPVLDKIPKGIIGDDEVFVKPGETLQLRNQPMVASGDIYDLNGSTVLVNSASVDPSIHKGYVIRYDDADYPFMDPSAPQNITFSIRSGQTGCYSAVDPDSGELTISPAQASDFEVTVTGSVGIYTVVKKVQVRILRIESVTLTFEGDDNTAKGTTVSQNGLKSDEEFTLSANVVAYNGRRTEVSDASGSALDFSVSWDKTRGNTLFEIVPGTQTGSRCTFKMNEVTATDMNIEVTATSVESTSLAYKNYAGVLTPVKGKFNGKTYKKPEDPKKQFDMEGDPGNFKRGKPVNVYLQGWSNDLEKACRLKSGDTLDLSKGYVKVVQLEVWERVYDLNGPHAERDITADALRYNEVIIKDGAGWKFNCPFTYNPNADYRYVINHRIYKAPSEDWTDAAQNFYTIDELKGMYTAAGKTLNEDTDLVAEGTGVRVTFPRMQFRYYAGQDAPQEYFRINTDNNRAYVDYYPRSFNQIPQKQFFFGFAFHESFDRYDDHFQSQMDNGEGGGVVRFDKKVRLYKPDSDGTYKYGIDNDEMANRIDASSTSSYEVTVDDRFMTVNDWHNSTYMPELSHSLPGCKFEFKGYEDRNFDWDKLEGSFRMVPVITVSGSGGGRYDHDYILFDSYIEFNNWNIEIPGTGLIATLLGINNEGAAERSYFPVPGDYNFPGETGEIKSSSGREVWTGATTWTNACNGYKRWQHPQTMYFTLKETGSTWYLTLYAQANTQGNQYWTAFARYRLDSSGKKWELDAGFNYDKDTAPILDK